MRAQGKASTRLLGGRGKIAAIASAALIALLIAAFFSANRPDGDELSVLPGSAEDTSCDGYQGEYGCYDEAWCLNNWTQNFASVARDVAAGEPVGFASGLFDVMVSDYEGETRDLATSALAKVVTVTGQAGEAAGTDEGAHQAALLCGNADFLDASIEAQVSYAG